MPVIYNDVPAMQSQFENLQWVIYWQNLSCRYSVVTYVVAKSLMPKICSDVSTTKNFHAGNLERHHLSVQLFFPKAAVTCLPGNSPASPAGKQ
jgi:hypothetical protein